MSVAFVFSAFSDTKMEEEDAPSSSRKRKRMEKKPGGEDNSKRPRSPTTSLNKAPLSMNRPVYEIGPPSWMKREISAYILSNHLVRTIIYFSCNALFSKTNYISRERYDNKQANKMPDRIDLLLEHELKWSAKESSCIAFVICSVSTCPALLLQTIAWTFCKAIGLCSTSEVTLRTTADEDHGLRSWQVRIMVYEIRHSGELTRGWRRF
jgi:hypothetical protein